MNAIPKEKAPHLTEVGKQYKQKQIIQQLPAHDFDEAYCDDLTDKERLKMKEFTQKREEEAAGQGELKEKPNSGREWVKLKVLIDLHCCHR